MKISKMAVVMFGLLFTLNSVEALNSWNTGFKATSNQTREVNAHGTCKKVKAGGTGIFIPTKNATEWSGFRTNAYRVGASLSNCCTWQNYTYQCGSTYQTYSCNCSTRSCPEHGSYLCTKQLCTRSRPPHCRSVFAWCPMQCQYCYTCSRYVPKYCTGSRCI